MKLKKMHTRLTKKQQLFTSEDMRYLQRKLKGGMSVYRNKLRDYQRRPKHRGALAYEYAFDARSLRRNHNNQYGGSV